MILTVAAVLFVISGLTDINGHLYRRCSFLFVGAFLAFVAYGLNIRS